MEKTLPEIIGFDESPMMSTAERVAELLHAARATILPHPKPGPRLHDEPDEAERRPAGNRCAEQIIHDLDQIARALRSDDDVDRPALAAALDGVRETLTNLLAGQGMPAADQSMPTDPPASLRPVPNTLQSEKGPRHAVIEETRG